MATARPYGGLEMLGYRLIVASTVRLGVDHYRSWWRWKGEWKPVRVMRLRDVRLSPAEIDYLLFGVALVIVAAYRETAMAFGVL